MSQFSEKANDVITVKELVANLNISAQQISQAAAGLLQVIENLNKTAKDIYELQAAQKNQKVASVSQPHRSPKNSG